MPQLRRLAIHAENPAQLAAFYQNVFDLEKIGEAGSAVFVSDGTFSLAFLPIPDSISSGFSYMDFETIRIESIRKKLTKTKNKEPYIIELSNKKIEYEMQNPNNNTINLYKKTFDTSYQ